jgi:hypothetical protein
MRSDEQSKQNESQHLHPRRKLELFFFENVGGGRTYIRFTRLAVILIIGLTVVSLASILIIFMLRACLKSASSVETSQHQTNHRGINHRFACLAQTFIVLREPSVLREPPERALNNPPLR